MTETNVVETKCPIRKFLRRNHTPLEKGLMIAGAFATGIAIGMILAPATDGIEISVARGGINTSIGSNNGSEFDD